MRAYIVVGVFHINFCLPSKVQNFSVATSRSQVTFKAFRRVKETLVSGSGRGGRGFPRQLVTLLSFDLPPH